MDTTLRATVIPRYKHDDEDATLGVDGYTTILTRRRGQGELRPHRDGDTTEWLLLKQPGVPATAEPSDNPQKINHNRGTVAFSTRVNPSEVVSDTIPLTITHTAAR